MQAIILAAGKGTRISNHIGGKPKCMIEIAGKTLLERQVQLLAKAGVKEFILCIGYRAGIVKNFVVKKFPKTKFIFVENKDYEKTNAIYSTYLASGFVKSDLFIIHSDVVFHGSIISTIKSGGVNWALVHRTEKNEKDFNCVIEKGCIKKIGVKIIQKSARFTVPFYKISKEFFIEWVKEIAEFVKKGEKNIYAETALSKTLEKFCLKPLFFDKEKILEIDDLHDLEWARKLFENE